jgi:hypothetical protein
MSFKVNFIGQALLGEIIRSMDVGKQYYACEDAIVVTVDGFGYIDLGGAVMDVRDENFTIPIKRTSSDTYQVDVSIDLVFTPVIANDELSADKTKDLIGPFKVDIIPFSELEYFKRMPLEELQTDLAYLDKYYPEEAIKTIVDLRVAIDLKKMQPKGN